MTVGAPGSGSLRCLAAAEGEVGLHQHRPTDKIATSTGRVIHDLPHHRERGVVTTEVHRVVSGAKAPAWALGLIARVALIVVVSVAAQQDGDLHRVG